MLASPNTGMDLVAWPKLIKYRPLLERAFAYTGLFFPVVYNLNPSLFGNLYTYDNKSNLVEFGSLIFC